MPDPKPDTAPAADVKPDAAQEEKKEEVKVDAFGVEENQRPEVSKEEKKEEKKQEVNIEDHPVVKGLKEEIENVKKEYGGNLTGQRKVIADLEAKVKAFEAGDKEVKDGEDVPFKEIKRSKDLTAEQRDEMTDTEIHLMDQLADIQEGQNKQYLESKKQNRDSQDSKVEDLNNTVKGFAKELAGDNVDVANSIIESAKMFNLEGLTIAEVKERVESAAKLVPDYTPPKEQEKKATKTAPVKKTGEDTDPFGVDKIVEEATAAKDGGGYEL